VAYDARNFHPGRAAEIQSGASGLGRIGQLSADGLKRLEIGLPVFVATIHFEALRAASRSAGEFRDWSRYPSVKRDLAFVTPVGIESAALLATIREGAGPLLDTARLFDVYSGERIGQGLKSLAFSLVFQSQGRTLADAEVDALVEAAVRLVEQRHGAKLRS
jgi:phenylalanyl-tRNA synthetase beta chain